MRKRLIKNMRPLDIEALCCEDILPESPSISEEGERTHQDVDKPGEELV